MAATRDVSPEVARRRRTPGSTDLHELGIPPAVEVATKRRCLKSPAPVPGPNGLAVSARGTPARGRGEQGSTALVDPQTPTHRDPSRTPRLRIWSLGRRRIASTRPFPISGTSAFSHPRPPWSTKSRPPQASTRRHGVWREHAQRSLPGARLDLEQLRSRCSPLFAHSSNAYHREIAAG